MFGRLYLNINRNVKVFFFTYIYLFAILRKGMRQNHRISVRDIILLPRQSPRRPPMLLMRLILSKKCQPYNAVFSCLEGARHNGPED